MFFYMSYSSPFRRNFLQKIHFILKRLKKDQKKKGIVSLQTKYSFSVILHKSIQACKRISFCLFSNRKNESGSMTVEAALVLALFLFACMNLISFIEIYRLQSNMNMQLHQKAKELAVVGVNVTQEDECIDLIYPYQAKPFVAVVGFQEFPMYSRMRTRAWTGYDNENSQEKENEEIVYVTEYGEVYHTTKSCSYLKLSIRAVNLEFIEELRNAEGACFYACEDCGSSCTNTVFVTTYGTRYHSTLRCSGLKRTIKEIPKAQVGSKKPCSKCG